MSPDALLKQLDTLQLPPPISFWPLSKAGMMGLVALLILSIVGVIRLVYYWRAQQAKHWVKAELNRIRTDIVSGIGVQSVCANLSLYLKKFFVEHKGLAEVGPLIGEPWLNFLATYSKNKAYTEGIGRHLITAPYQPETRVDLSLLLELVQHTVKIK